MFVHIIIKFLDVLLKVIQTKVKSDEFFNDFIIWKIICMYFPLNMKNENHKKCFLKMRPANEKYEFNEVWI